MKCVICKYILIPQTAEYNSYLPTSSQASTNFSLKHLQDLVGDFPSQELHQVCNSGKLQLWREKPSKQ